MSQTLKSHSPQNFQSFKVERHITMLKLEDYERAFIWLFAFLLLS